MLHASSWLLNEAKSLVTNSTAEGGVGIPPRPLPPIPGFRGEFSRWLAAANARHQVLDAGHQVSDAALAALESAAAADCSTISRLSCSSETREHLFHCRAEHTRSFHMDQAKALGGQDAQARAAVTVTDGNAVRETQVVWRLLRLPQFPGTARSTSIVGSMVGMPRPSSRRTRPCEYLPVAPCRPRTFGWWSPGPAP
jgi:hypothetical protein